MSEAARPTVAYVGSELGLGGTEKGMVAHAVLLDRERFTPRVVTVHQLGPRQTDLDRAGVRVDCAAGDPRRLRELLDGVPVVHVFRHGIHEPLVVDACRDAGVRVLIESNIFGAVDKSPDEARFACHLFLSQMCLLRYQGWVGESPDFSARHRVSYLPVDSGRLRSLAVDPREAKLRLGLDPDRPVVGRLGRAADLKWRDLLIDMGPELLRLVPDVQFLYVGMTPAKQRRAGRLSLLEHLKAVPPVAGERELVTLYSACDVLVNAAVIGESQGVAIAEALALGIPVVTCSTPWADNAQVEIVDHGVDGWVANHPRPFAEAVADLLGDEERRRSFGAAGAAKVQRLLDPGTLTRQLEQLYAHHLSGGEGTVQWRPSEADVDRFAADYPARARRQFRALTLRERAEAEVARRRDDALRLHGTVKVVSQSALARAQTILPK